MRVDLVEIYFPNDLERGRTCRGTSAGFSSTNPGGTEFKEKTSHTLIHILHKDIIVGNDESGESRAGSGNVEELRL